MKITYPVYLEFKQCGFIYFKLYKRFPSTMLGLFMFLQILLIWPSNISNNELVRVSVIFRHGDRTIKEYSYPNDPYQSRHYWPEGFRELTNRGKLRQYELGQWLRKRYNSFLSNISLSNEVYVFSSDLGRNIMSAESNMAGLFPPSADEMWNPDLKWQPIPVHTIPTNDDNLIQLKAFCPKYDHLFEQFKHSPTFLKFDEGNSDLYAYVSACTGLLVNDIAVASNLYRTLKVESENDYVLPNWTKSVFPEKLKYITAFSLASVTFTTDLARLKIGPLINNIAEQFEGERSVKFVVYSGHDLTVTSILNALHLFDYQPPPFAASVIFELHKINESHFVNIFYKNGSDLHEMVLKNCEFDCPLDEFLEVIRPIRITSSQWEKECFHENSIELVATKIILIFCIIFGLAILINYSFTYYTPNYLYLILK